LQEKAGSFIMKKLILWIIDFYRLGISPLKPPVCRFVPSCSLYAKEAILKYGVLKGIGLALLRLLRCNPFHSGGWDPVR
jgi:putative membrane protein insertion efficiency factor